MLTEREIKILKYLIMGLQNDVISDKLHISIHTTKAHLESIFKKLGVKNRVQAAIKTISLGIVSKNDILDIYDKNNSTQLN